MSKEKFIEFSDLSSESVASMGHESCAAWFLNEHQEKGLLQLFTRQANFQTNEAGILVSIKKSNTNQEGHHHVIQ